MTKRAALIYNPSAGGGKARRKKKRVEALLAAKHVDYDLFVTESEQHLVETARRVIDTHPIIIGAGGDTSINIIATQILQGGQNNTLGMISLGSVNDFGRELKVHKLEAAINAIHYGCTQAIDVGVVTSTAEKKPYYFLVSASLGLGVVVNRYVDIWMRRHPFFSSFRSATQGGAAMAAIRQAFKNKDIPMELELEMDSTKQVQSVTSSLMVFSNASSFAGSFRPNPQASLVSGKLDCCAFQAESFTDLVKRSIDLKRQKHMETENVAMFRDEAFRVYSKKGLEFQLDGEIIKTEGDASVSILPKALNVITGPEFC
ncbi:MAG: hypothetical protein GY765_30670 [bacterium]|nr:hypothetical protein [bacterium]